MHNQKHQGMLMPMLFTMLLSVGTLQAQMGYFNNVFAHQKDSLVKQLAKHPAQDTARANALLNILLCAVYLNQRKQVLPYCEEAIALSHALNDKKIEASCFEWKGHFYKSAQKNDSAFLYLDSAIELAGNTNNEPLRDIKGFSQFEKGMIYEFQENFYTALNNYFDALKNCDKNLRNQKMIALRVANIYQRLNNNQKALEYYKAALTFYQEANGTKPTLDELGICTCIAQIYFDQGNLAEASYYLYKTKAVMPDTVEITATGGYYQLAGQIALKESKNDSAILLFKQALKYFSHMGQVHADEISTVCANIAGLQMDRKNMVEAKQYAEQSLAAAKQSGHKQTLADALTIMAEYDSWSGNQLGAYQALHQATLLNDSVYAEANIKQANTLAAVYENGKKEKEIVQLETDKRVEASVVKQQTLLNLIFLVTIVALVIISLVSYLNFKKKQEIEKRKIAELEKEKQLTGIEAMLKGEESERARLAKDLHDGLGGMLSGVRMSFSTMKENLVMNVMNATVFDKSLQQLDSTIVELRKVAHNMMPEALVKYGLKSAVIDFCESMQLSGDTKIICEQFGTRVLDDIAEVNTYRIIQELVNNAVIHGRASQVLVQLTITANKVLITVEDNGKGFEPRLIKKPHGIGLNNIRHRVNYFSGKMEIISQPGDGATINIELMA